MSDTTTRDGSHSGDTVTFSNKQHHDARKEDEQPERQLRSGTLMSASTKRRERIRQLETRLERERSRENEASRKERNGQLFVWGAMIEGVYRSGGEQERNQIRLWATKHLTDKRHFQRAELGFARIEEEKANGENA